MKTNNKRPLFEHWQIISLFLMIYDFAAVVAAYAIALWLRFDGSFADVPAQYWHPYTRFILPYAAFCVLVFWLFRLYRSMWRFASFVELERTVLASLLTSVLHAILITVWFYRMPISYYILGAFFQFFLLIAIRFSYRFISLLRTRLNTSARDDTSRVMLIGAGNAGQMILRDTQLIHHSGRSSDRVVCIIDDNRNKWNRYIDGVPIVGGRDSILENVEKYDIDKIYVAIPSATAEEKRDILDICKETDCVLKNLPSIYHLRDGVGVSNLQAVSMEDLLGREPIRPDMQEVYDYINGKVVLVTGGGGSIGSELCRQIASHNPKQLIIFDIYENNAYAIQLELRKKYPDLDLVTLIGSVRDSRRIFQVFETYHPNIVYHAAAHKHVPLMEDSPCEAIKNNAIGTYKTAYAAIVHGCDKFVLISTDKAVNPTNIMGASKRLCEMIIQSFDQKIKEGTAGSEIPELITHWEDETSGKKKQTFHLDNVHTELVAVRFGNVLGSNGSVIPVFKQQIEEGGPVTVTHPDIIRYFMTVPEAVSLVMLAGTYARGGEIFVLDMGSPVKIDTLARNLIRLSGYKPDVDIKIEYTGLRPGEKLYEEKLMAEEGLQMTDNKLIFIGYPIPFDVDEFLANLESLMLAAYNNKKDIKTRVAAMVNTYHPDGIPTMVKDGKYTDLAYTEPSPNSKFSS